MWNARLLGRNLIIQTVIILVLIDLLNMLHLVFFQAVKVFGSFGAIHEKST